MFYKVYQIGEQTSKGIVSLSEEEHKSVTKYLDEVDRLSWGDCGKNRLGDVPFNTYEEASESLSKEN